MHLPKTLFGALLALSIPCAALAQECGGDFSAWRAGVEAEAAAQGVGVTALPRFVALPSTSASSTATAPRASSPQTLPRVREPDDQRLPAF